MQALLPRLRLLPRPRLAATRVSGFQTAESLEGQVGVEGPWIYLWSPLPNGDYDLAWFYTDRFPLAIYVAAKRGGVERGNWVSPPAPPSQLFGSDKTADLVDLRGTPAIEQGDGYVDARASNGHVISASVNTVGYGPTVNVQSSGAGPYGSSIGSSLHRLVSVAYPGIPALGALPATSPLGMLGF